MLCLQTLNAMCGILCYISRTNLLDKGETLLNQCQHLLQNRGPNHSGQSSSTPSILLYGTVLWQQGAQICHQPVENERFSMLFNGDLFIDRDDMLESDSKWLFEKIAATNTVEQIGELFRLLKGPFSFILLDRQLQRVYFGRDSIGRNSLLIGITCEGMVITSVIGNYALCEIVELPPNGIYYVDVAAPNLEINLLPWKITLETSPFDFTALKDIFIDLSWFSTARTEVGFNYHTLLKSSKNLSNEEIFNFLLSNQLVSSTCGKLIDILSNSVYERIACTPNYCKKCIEMHSPCHHSKVGVLFSGGIDCTILALLADKFVEENIPLDLLNVAFEKTKGSIDHSVNAINWEVPDRVTGRRTLTELQRLRPKRLWNFVEINVTRRELNSQKQRISDLVFPLKSVLDESLGAALWFASRGEGISNGNHYSSSNRVLLLGSGADELFGGYSRHRAAFYRYLGNSHSEFTDEQIQHAFQNLSDELDIDWNRLPSRNLARDDRVICDHGVTPRTPYLQEDFISFVQNMQASQRCYHPLGPGIGDKLTLRLCGYMLGLATCASLRKRALQFGSRIADKKQNAKDDSTFLNSL
ncbi:asparagine synthetase domain-containing protein CG17486 [Toxorhynchites rutilus septentrionalis]|uniref:asparagine synthetase domain-containing protein CG17486 n=1 Tax=Toxorhynchites rutilus septentrionalis TaxID=329112 RepID=UPI0024794A65|nr:asparagine synthetase domain-containing protein CG17486 [Toxorhynchites rutilus septentrionalis]